MNVFSLITRGLIAGTGTGDGTVVIEPVATVVIAAEENLEVEVASPMIVEVARDNPIDCSVVVDEDEGLSVVAQQTINVSVELEEG